MTKKNIFEKRYLTTGDIGELCGVNFRTVIRWIEAGLMKAHQLPLRGDNRVEPKDFMEFLRDHKMPIPEELQPSGRRVLIVDDEAPMAKSIQRALRMAKFETTMVHDGFMAGVLALVFQPSVITLDLRMPGLGGLEVIKALRKQSEISQIKILVVSAMPFDELQEALAAGADDILEKPFKNKDLVQKVKDLLESTGPVMKTPGIRMRPGTSHRRSV